MIPLCSCIWKPWPSLIPCLTDERYTDAKSGSAPRLASLTAPRVANSGSEPWPSDFEASTTYPTVLDRAESGSGAQRLVMKN